MPLDVSSSFTARTRQKTPVGLTRRFTIGSSDYSAFVTKWPKIANSATKFRPTNVVVPCANEGQDFNFLHEDPISIVDSAGLQFGFSEVISNPGFEEGDTGWGKEATSWTIINDEANARSGSFVARFVGSGNAGLRNNTTIPCLTGDVFTARGFIKATGSVNSGNPIVRILWKLADLTDISANNGNTITDSNYRESIVTATAPNSARFADFNFFITNPTTGTWFFDDATLSQLNTIYTGKIGRLRFTKGIANVTITDKFASLGEHTVGTSDDPVLITGSSSLADLAFALVSSHGGLSTVQDASNPDIDFASFDTWKTDLNDQGVQGNAEFTGQKVSDCLRRLARIADSQIFINTDNKVRFARFSIIDSNVVSLGIDETLSFDLTVDEQAIINRQFVSANYDTTSNFHALTVVNADTPSINSYGLHEDNLKETIVWLVDSVAANTLSQRIIASLSEPLETIKAKTTLFGFTAIIGETVDISDPLINKQAGYRIAKNEIDLDKGEVTFFGDRKLPGTAGVNAFTLDVSSLGGADILT